MDIEDVRFLVARIAESAHDDESAHNQEDSLYRDVLRAIRDGETEDAAALALAALEAEKISFARYTA